MAVSEVQINEAKRAISEASSQLNEELRVLTSQVRELLGDAADELATSAKGLSESQAIAKKLRSLGTDIPTLSFAGGQVTAVKDRRFKPDHITTVQIS